MTTTDENNPTMIKRSNVQVKGGAEMGSRKFVGMETRSNRRVLGSINQNLVAGHSCPCVVNKRGLSETNGIRGNNLPVPAHRPITRRFAAQIASSQQHCSEENKKPKIAAEEFTVWEDIPLADHMVEENEEAKDQPVPMSLELTETEVSNDKNQMEVEMEDIFEETIIDIDGNDANNPLAAVEYVEDLFANYRKMEGYGCASPNYMAQQFDITERMRSILIDWLIEVHHKFELREETLFLTINLIDRFLEKQGVVRKKLQLVGLVAMLLASKYEEVSAPLVEDLIFISDKAYTRKEVLEMERMMLNTLQFNISVPTAYVFMRRYLKAAQCDRKLELLSFFMVELCLVEYEMLKFPPSFISAAAIYTAQTTLYGVQQWSKMCEWHTSYTEDQLLECSISIIGYHQKATTGKLTAVYRKYSTSKFGYAAKCEPAHFLVQNQQ